MTAEDVSKRVANPSAVIDRRYNRLRRRSEIGSTIQAEASVAPGEINLYPLERITKRELRPQSVNRVIGKLRFREPGVGDVLIFDAQPHEEIVADIVFRPRRHIKREVEVLTKTTL